MNCSNSTRNSKNRCVKQEILNPIFKANLYEQLVNNKNIVKVIECSFYDKMFQRDQKASWISCQASSSICDSKINSGKAQLYTEFKDEGNDE